MFYRWGLPLFALLFAMGAQALDCGGESEPCVIAGGAYHIAVPSGWQSGPAVIYLHGFGGTGAQVIRNKGFVKGFTDRGYAVIAPTALPLDGNRATDWAVRDGDSYARDDSRFLHDVLADAVTRAGVNPDQLLLSGFSRGGSMVWEVACLTPDFALAYAPVSGGFWLPKRLDCAGPVHLLHTHGFADKTVPLEGRSLNDSVTGQEYIQDDIWEGLGLWRQENACVDAPSEVVIAEGLWRRRWGCSDGSLALILHKGGHGRPKDWTAMTLDWFESLDN
ncbi:MAG: hypothetical protein RIC87_19305 [Kiloniellales bacterium]